MEVLGSATSGVTLTCLFQACVEAFDAFRATQSQSVDLEKLILKLNIEKCRLYTWGQAMGLTSESDPSGTRQLDLCQYPELVRGTLEVIVKVLRDSEKLENEFGCKPSPFPHSMRQWRENRNISALQQLNASFDNFKFKSKERLQQTNFAETAYWVIEDRRKFEYLVIEAKSLIDDLQKITNDLQSQVAHQEMMNARIRRIQNVRTLYWVSEVSGAYYPELSDAASVRAESISLSECGTLHAGVLEWEDVVSNKKQSTADVKGTITTDSHQELARDVPRTEDTRLKAKHQPNPENNRDISRPQASLKGTGSPPKSIFSPYSDSFSAASTPGSFKLWVEDLKEDPATANSDKPAVVTKKTQNSQHGEFQEECKAVEQWFSVLSRTEKEQAFHALRKIFQRDLYHDQDSPPVPPKDTLREVVVFDGSEKPSQKRPPKSPLEDKPKKKRPEALILTDDSKYQQGRDEEVKTALRFTSDPKVSPRTEYWGNQKPKDLLKVRMAQVEWLMQKGKDLEKMQSEGKESEIRRRNRKITLKEP